MLQAVLLLVVLVALGFAGRGTDWWLLAIALLLTSFTCAGIGMVTASFSRTLDNFAGIMNFVIFPVFFLSGSLYPVRDLPPVLGWIATVNPYTYGVDLLKHALAPGAAMGADFGVGLDIAVLVGATAIAHRRRELALLAGVRLRADDPRADDARWITWSGSDATDESPSVPRCRPRLGRGGMRRAPHAKRRRTSARRIRR